MLLACAITFRLTKTFISPFKRSTLQDKVNFNHRFDQLLADVTTYIEDNVTRDAIIWLQEVSAFCIYYRITIQYELFCFNSSRTSLYCRNRLFLTLGFLSIGLFCS